MTLANRTITPANDYRALLARRGIMPMRIERTEKRAGDVVLHSWAREVEKVA